MRLLQLLDAITTHLMLQSLYQWVEVLCALNLLIDKVVSQNKLPQADRSRGNHSVSEFNSHSCQGIDSPFLIDTLPDVPSMSSKK